MPDADVVVSWFASVPDAVKAKFSRPTKFIQLPIPPGRNYKGAIAELGSSPVAGAIAKYAPGTKALRVALLGFSEGCSGVVGLLASNDGGRVDSVFAIDGAHAGYTNGKTPPINPPKAWFEFAKLAVVNERLFVLSYSSVVPPGYASTTEVANWIWTNLNLDSQDPQASPPLPALVPAAKTIKSNALPGIPSVLVEYPSPPWKAQRRSGGLVLLGLNNNQPAGVADHQYQAAVMLPLTLEAFLVPRWNENDPANGTA